MKDFLTNEFKEIYLEIIESYENEKNESYKHELYLVKKFWFKIYENKFSFEIHINIGVIDLQCVFMNDSLLSEEDTELIFNFLES